MDVRRAVASIAVVASTIAVLAVAPARADPGDLDPTFGRDGLVRIRREFLAVDIALQPNGKILLLGLEFELGKASIVRLRPHGRIDRSYGDHGFASFFAEGVGTQVSGIEVDASGRAVVAVAEDALEHGNLLVVHRFTRGGAFDRSFGRDGHAVTRFPEPYRSGGVDVVGRIVAGGIQWNSLHHVLLTVARYRSNGFLDRTFGADGKVVREFCCEGAGSELAVDPQGRVVVGAFRAGGGRVNVLRLRAGGNLDRTFSGDGRAPLPAGIDDVVSLDTGPNGEVAVLGTPLPFRSHWSLVVLGPDGRLDAGFGGGVVSTRVSCKVLPYEALFQDDGRILVVGNARRCRERAKGRPVIARYLPNGDLDASFGDGGLVLLPFHGRATAVALDPNRRILTAQAAEPDAAGLLP
jgi:uncharacterized delta-60 repeat protein